MQPTGEDTAPHGGIRFGADASNAYAGEVGYDEPAEYDSELVEEEDEDVDDEGRMQGSHPSTLQRRTVSFHFCSKYVFLPNDRISFLVALLCHDVMKSLSCCICYFMLNYRLTLEPYIFFIFFVARLRSRT